jgi:2Fe-2S ferredoxin
MVTLTIRQRNATEHVIEAAEDCNLMQAIRYGNIDDMQGTCGGFLACAQCHVYVDPTFLDKLPPMSDEENELLSGAEHRQPNSRLGCQIPAAAELSGAHIIIAPE